MDGPVRMVDDADWLEWLAWDHPDFQSWWNVKDDEKCDVRLFVGTIKYVSWLFLSFFFFVYVSSSSSIHPEILKMYLWIYKSSQQRFEVVWWSSTNQSIIHQPTRVAPADTPSPQPIWSVAWLSVKQKIPERGLLIPFSSRSLIYKQNHHEFLLLG